MDSLTDDSDGSVKDQNAHRNETVRVLPPSFKGNTHFIGN